MKREKGSFYKCLKYATESSKWLSHTSLLVNFTPSTFGTKSIASMRSFFVSNGLIDIFYVDQKLNLRIHLTWCRKLELRISPLSSQETASQSSLLFDLGTCKRIFVHDFKSHLSDLQSPIYQPTWCQKLKLRNKSIFQLDGNPT